jgi:hypothetical protein
MAMISATSNEGVRTITSNDGDPDFSSAVLTIEATNPDYNQPVLRIKQAGTCGGAVSIRIDDQNPDIEFVEIPADGGILYVANGALMYRGSNDTVTMIAPA